MDSPTSSTSIKFNVGGSIYQISKSLLDRYPDSMLASISSDQWREGSLLNGSDNKNEIFVDRNGERFQYVLDYMRDSRVELPLSIPRGQFVLDMEYFALDYDNSNITLSVASPRDLFHSLGRYRDYFTEKSKEIETRYKSVAAEKLANDIAKEYFSQYLEHPKASLQPGQEKLFFSSKWVSVKFPPGHAGLFTVDEIREHLLPVGLKCEGELSYPRNAIVGVNVSLI
jgi:BTB/POZ domain